MSDKSFIQNYIREVPDFPKPGVQFKDITPILENPAAYQAVIKELKKTAQMLSIDAIVGVESRGFIFGMTLAYELQKPFILARKKGKLPYNKISQKYALEYGEAEVEMHTDSIKPGWKVIIHDDLLATGGTAAAVAELVQKQKGSVEGFLFLINLSFLNGTNVLKNYSHNIHSILTY